MRVGGVQRRVNWLRCRGPSVETYGRSCVLTVPFTVDTGHTRLTVFQRINALVHETVANMSVLGYYVGERGIY